MKITNCNDRFFYLLVLSFPPSCCWKLCYWLYTCLGLLCSLFKKKLFILFIYLFLAALGLCCCGRASSSCGEQGLLFVAVRGLLIAVASFVAEHGL